MLNKSRKFFMCLPRSLHSLLLSLALSPVLALQFAFALARRIANKPPTARNQEATSPKPNVFEMRSDIRTSRLKMSSAIGNTTIG